MSLVTLLGGAWYGPKAIQAVATGHACAIFLAQFLLPDYEQTGLCNPPDFSIMFGCVSTGPTFIEVS
jgi:hypothetical protein